MFNLIEYLMHIRRLCSEEASLGDIGNDDIREKARG